MAKLLGYDFDIVYKPGLDNWSADALYRIHQKASIAAISVPSLISILDLQALVQANLALAKIVQDISLG